MNIQEKLSELQKEGNYRTLTHLQHEGCYVFKEGKKYLNLSSNDYLGIASKIDLRKEFLSSLDVSSTGFSASASRLQTGSYPEYNLLEEKLSSLYGSEAAIVFNSGYHANTGILPAITDERSLILADKLVHASIIDGIRLCSAKSIRYRHNDYQQLERLVLDNASRYEQIIIVTESIFSMDGDEADLPRLCQIKKQYPHVMLYVDEAHAFGVRGTSGLGCAEENGCIADIDFLVGTFGKALASIGAFVVCSNLIRECLINRMRTFIFTTALPSINISWSLFILEKLPYFSVQREYVKTISQRLRRQLPRTAGSSHIVPMLIGGNDDCVRISQELAGYGFFASAIRPPTVPAGTARIRFSLSANMPEDEIERLIRTLAKIQTL